MRLKDFVRVAPLCGVGTKKEMRALYEKVKHIPEPPWGAMPYHCWVELFEAFQRARAANR